MTRRLTILATLIVLCGVLVLSAPALANGVKNGKVAPSTGVSCSVVQPAQPKSAALSQPVCSLSSTVVAVIKFQLRRWLRLPITVGIRESTSDPPQKSQSEPGGTKPWLEAARDNGGHGEDE